MKRKNLDTMREIRLTTNQLIIPSIIIGVMVYPLIKENGKRLVDSLHAKYAIWKIEKKMREAYK